MIPPMLGLSRYILRQLVVGMVLVAAALLCVMWLTQSLRFIELIVNKGLSIFRFTELTLLLLPSFLVIVLPISLFSVTLFTYTKLNSDRELVVMRSVGLSHARLAQPALVLSLAATLIGFVLSLWFIPWTVREFHDMQWSIRNDITNVLLQEGVFNKFGDGVTIYVSSRGSSGELKGLLVHDRRQPERPVTLMAESGALVRSADGPKVFMVNGNRQQLTNDSGKLSVLYFDQYTLDLSSTSPTGEARHRDAREMTTPELLTANPIGYEPAEFRKLKVELHQRFAAPFYNLGLPLLALACLLPASFNRRGQGSQIVFSVALMVGAESLSLTVTNLATSNLALWPLIYLAALCPIAGGLWFVTEGNLPRFRAFRRLVSS